MDKSQQVATPAVAQCQAPTTGVQAAGVSNSEVQVALGTAMEPWPASGGTRELKGLDVDASGLGPDVGAALEAIGEAQTCSGQATDTVPVAGGTLQVNMTASCLRRQYYTKDGSAGAQSTTGGIATTTTTTELGVEAGIAPGGVGAKGTAKASNAVSDAATTTQTGGITVDGLPTRYVDADAILAVDIQFFPADELGTPAVETVHGVVGRLEFSEVTW